MSQTDITSEATVGAEPTASTEPRSIWMIVLGVLTVLTGIAALAFPFASTLAVEIMAGSLFFAVGVFTTVHAFMETTWRGFFWELLIGVLHVVAGIVFLLNPLGGMAALTVLLGAVFAAEGVLRMILGFQMRPAKLWGLAIASGGLSFLLGILVLAGLANGSSLLTTGALVGINFIFAGVATTTLGVQLSRGAAAGE